MSTSPNQAGSQPSCDLVKRLGRNGFVKPPQRLPSG